jgi:hypothetical protein
MGCYLHRKCSAVLTGWATVNAGTVSAPIRPIRAGMTSACRYTHQDTVRSPGRLWRRLAGSRQVRRQVILFTGCYSASAPARIDGGNGRRPISFGIGAEPRHQEHRRAQHQRAIEASGWRSMVRKSIALLVPQPGQKTLSHGVPASTPPGLWATTCTYSSPVPQWSRSRSLSCRGC